MRPYRIYVDTSVFGGCFDEEFAEESGRFFDLVHQGQVKVLFSRGVVEELEGAPPNVRQILNVLLRAPDLAEFIETRAEMLELRDSYIASGVVSARSLEDATHVAAATIARAWAIVSWNFKHLVRLDRIRGYNEVNLRLGYGLISIVSPAEVRFDDPEAR